MAQIILKPSPPSVETPRKRPALAPASQGHRGKRNGIKSLHTITNPNKYHNHHKILPFKIPLSQLKMTKGACNLCGGDTAGRWTITKSAAGIEQAPTPRTLQLYLPTKVKSSTTMDGARGLCGPARVGQLFSSQPFTENIYIYIYLSADKNNGVLMATAAKIGNKNKGWTTDNLFSMKM